MLVLNLVPPVGAEAWTPQGGKYLSLATDSVVTYDPNNHQVSPSPDTVFAYECPGYAGPSGESSHCGNCAYIPSQAGWRLPTTQYTYGRCVLVDTEPPLLEPVGVVTVRADLRLHENAPAWGLAWGYNAYVETFNVFGNLIGSQQVVGPQACGSQEVDDHNLVHAGEVFYCQLPPQSWDLRDYRSGSGTTLCLHLQFLLDVADTSTENVDSEVVGCVIA